ncbi:MAG: peptide-methionine (R)-S-oxide reductase MsrB [Betaproteobacteria bacterium]|nr:peptide-methionine (R)-S-oxide reductase MsrB [Betaproteobacteria bacterium]
MLRRNFLNTLAALPLALVGGRGAQAQSGRGQAPDVAALQADWKSLLAPNADVAKSAEPLTLTNAEWKKRLSADAYDVLRHEGTEPPGTSPLNREKRPGVFVCAGCALPLFTSAMKYESGTGWPSFFTTIPGALATKTDYKMIWPRTEYHCVRCGGHHGHLFDDGPPPTRQRYCNNGVALRFIPRTA